MCRIIWGKIQGLSFAVTHSVYIFFPTKKSKARKLKITYIIFNFHTRVFLVTQEGIIAAGNSILCLTWQSVKIESVKINRVNPEIVIFSPFQSTMPWCQSPSYMTCPSLQKAVPQPSFKRPIICPTYLKVPSLRYNQARYGVLSVGFLNRYRDIK